MLQPAPVGEAGAAAESCSEGEEEIEGAPAPGEMERPAPMDTILVDTDLPCSTRRLWAVTMTPDKEFFDRFVAVRARTAVEAGDWVGTGGH